MAKKKVEGFSTQELTTLLTVSLSKIMNWMPYENISKAICVPDPRDSTKLCAVHNGPEGITILIDEGYTNFIEDLLCDDCQSQLVPFSVIYTGFNNETGEFDPQAIIGLYGAHDESDGSIELDDEQPNPDDLSNKRTLN